MAPLVTGTAFIGIVFCMFVTLATLNAVARYSLKRRMNQLAGTDPQFSGPGAKIIALPKNTMKAPKERFIIKDSVSEEQTV